MDKRTLKLASKIGAKSGGKAIPYVGEALMLADAAPELWVTSRDSFKSGVQTLREVRDGKGLKGKASAYGSGLLRSASIGFKGNLRAAEAALSLVNPAKVRGLPPMFDGDVYDPREESVRAVVRGTGGMWGVAVGKYAGEHSIPEIIQRSWERYQDPDHLIRARQTYELMLGRERVSGPYRVTCEPTFVGLRYFVWPLAQGNRIPQQHKRQKDAEEYMAILYRQHRKPLVTLPAAPYTEAELTDWLPREEVFAGRGGGMTRARATEVEKSRPAARAPRTSGAAEKITPLERQYIAAYGPNWYMDEKLAWAFLLDEPPLRR